MTIKRNKAKGPKQPGPTFIAHFADSVVTRMSCYEANQKFDLARGINLARAACSSRTRRKPPPILKASFITANEGDVLAEFDAEQLNVE